jgi:eukaryotic-like serine/threonine-protein kinase
MPPKPLEPGDPLRLGRFELLGRLGEGGQGIVYLGRGTNPGEDRVAVKVLRSTVDATVLERLARELDAIHQVQPFVTAGVIEASAEGDRRFVVSEFIDGPSLQERVDARGPLPEGDLQRLAVGTATALTAIHGAGVVHRDFKPANVLLGPDGPRVVDFGIARLTDAATITSGLIGTPSYVTPEQLAGARPTSAVDVFAWALTMIFAATGRLAFGADSVPAVMHRIMYEEPDLSGLPPSLRPIVRECLAKDPARRPSARDLLLRLVDPSAQRIPPARTGPAALVDSVPHTGPLPHPGSPSYTGSLPPLAEPTISGHEPTRLPEPTRPPEPGPAPAPSRRRPILAACGAAAVAALIVGGVLLLNRGSPPGTPATESSSLAGHTSGPATAAAQTTPASQATGVTIPAAFAGTWRGTATMSAIGVSNVSLKNSITFTFVAGGRTAQENNQSCINTLSLTGATATALTFSEPQTAQCVAGMVTFTRQGANLAYRWTDNIEQNVATLRKS